MIVARSSNLFLVVFILLLTSVLNGQEVRVHKTIEVDDQRFTFIVTADSSYKCTLTIKRDQKITFSDTLIDFYDSGEFSDFNGDGHTDLLTFRHTNTTWNQLYLYDPTLANYKHIEGFRQYPNSLPVHNSTGLYYSYRKNGCADANWFSDLLIIEDNRIKKLARINGIGCPRNAEKPRIDIQVFHGDESFSVLETIPLDTIDSIEGNKWKFISSYWSTHAKNLKKL